MGVVALSLVSLDRAETGQLGGFDGQEGLGSSADADSEAFGPAGGAGYLATDGERMTLGTWAASTGVVVILLERMNKNRRARAWTLQGPPENRDTVRSIMWLLNEPDVLKWNHLKILR